MEDIDQQPPDPNAPAATTGPIHGEPAGPQGRYVVPEEDRVPVVEKAAYAMGVVSDHYAQFAIHAFLMPFFNVVLKLNPVLIGVAMGCARLWDAVNDPLIGTLSDRCKSRFGRRRPFLFFGCILTGIVFPLIWLMPTGWVELPAIFSIPVPGIFGLWESTEWPITWPLIWLVVGLIVYYSCYSLLSVPYEALGMELTPDYQERTNVYTFRTYVQKLFDLGNAWLLPIATAVAAWFAAKELAPGLVGDAKDTAMKALTEQNLLRAVPIVAIGVGVMIIASGLLPAIFCRERYGKIAQAQENENPLSAAKSLAGNLPFWVVALSISIYLLGVMSNGVLGFYVHSYYVYPGDIKGGAILGGIHGTVGMICGFIGAFVIDILARRFDKKPLLVTCVTVMLLCTLAMSITYQPNNPYLTLVTRPFYAIAETGFWVLIISMRADVGDWDEFKSGRRREGMIAAFINWTVKLAITLAAVIGGILLQNVVKFDADLGANQPEDVLSRLKWTYVIVQSSTTAIALLLLLIYPLTRAKLAVVRETLEERRGKV